MGNPYDKVKWGVEVIGMGDYMPCPDFRFATERAEGFNRFIRESFWDQLTDNDGCFYCIVIRWDDEENGVHDPASVDWEDPYGCLAK